MFVKLLDGTAVNFPGLTLETVNFWRHIADFRVSTQQGVEVLLSDGTRCVVQLCVLDMSTPVLKELNPELAMAGSGFRDSSSSLVPPAPKSSLLVSAAAR